MSLYNMLFGVNTLAPAILAVLDVRVDQVPRFRDAYVDVDYLGNQILAVYTRMGGGNAECWKQYGDDYDHNAYCDCLACKGIPFMESLPGFLRMVDDEYDCTYRTFYYRVPDEYKDAFAQFSTESPLTPEEKFKRLLGELQRGEKTPGTEKAAQVGVEMSKLAQRLLKK